MSDCPPPNVSLTNMLQWSIANTAPRDANAPPFTPQMPPEEYKKWSDVMFKDDASKMKELLRVLTTTGATVEERETALEELNFLTETLDNANDLSKLGGLPPLVAALSDPSAGIRQRASWTLGTCVQNNHPFQHLLMQGGGLEPLLKLLQEDPVPEVRSKALFCLSGLLCNNKEGCDEFSRKGGWQAMVRCFRRGDLNLARKLTFILNNFMKQMPAIKDLLIEPESAATILDLLQMDDTDLCEKTLTLLRSIMEQSPRNVKRYKEQGAEKRLQELDTRLRALSKEHQDAYDNCFAILQQLQSWLQKSS
eukprot:Mycagemm_TRINITY_DN10053_c0_g2::TRINITY_DN10053_c0_g2_i1::g.2056::m.2056 type:complete len:308 gc:universal TRINITY_DN10053_c0_g2_i1:985-62(-)